MPPCDIHLSLIPTRPDSYTSLDTLRGKVLINVNKEIDVENVQVKFEGFAKTEIEVRERVHSANGSTQTRHVVKKETHTLVHQTKTLFPPPNVRNVSNSKTKFTLTPGEYEYDFQFTVPMTNECGDTFNPNYNSFRHFPTPLPPSCAGAGHSVNYLIKVTIRRASWLKTNIREIKTPHLRPFDPIDEILAFSQPLFLSKESTLTGMIPKRIATTEKPSGPESYTIPKKNSISERSSNFFRSVFKSDTEDPHLVDGQDVPFALEARIDGPFVTTSQAPNYQLFITSKHGPEKYRGIDNQSSGLGQFILKSLRIELAAFANLTAESHTEVTGATYPILTLNNLNYEIDLADLAPNTLAQQAQNAPPYQLAINPTLYQDATVKETVPPTFRTCNIFLEHKLQIVAVFAENAKSWTSKKVVLSAPVKVLSGIPAPEEYIQFRQIPPDVAAGILARYPSHMKRADANEPESDDEPSNEKIPGPDEKSQPPPYNPTA